MKSQYLFAAAAALSAVAAPAIAQTAYPYQQQYPQAYPQQYQQAYPQQYQQAYPQQYQQAYPQSGYGYQQGYGTGTSVVGQVIDQLLGNRYNVSDRTAVSQCASAAMSQASAQYRPNAYGQGYNRGYNNNAMRVTAINSVQRRGNGLSVKGQMSSGMGYGGYANQGYANQADLSFRCNVDYRGAVTNLRITRAASAYRRY